MSSPIQIKDCVDNHEKYVAILATLPDKELAKKLDLVHLQTQLAEQTTNTAALELLEIWHHQIIEARLYKAEHSIADAPNEIELAIADIETVLSKSEEREQAMDTLIHPQKKSRLKVQPTDDDSQLTLF